MGVADVLDADFVPATREMTVRDLLTHTSGPGSGGLGSMGSTDIQRQPAEKLADFLPRQAGSALDFQPGTRWSYSVSAGWYGAFGNAVMQAIAQSRPAR